MVDFTSGKVRLTVEEAAGGGRMDKPRYIAHLMRNSLGRVAPENAEQAFSGGFAAIDETDFELIRYSHFN